MATVFVVRPIFRRLVTNLNGSRKYLVKTTVKTRIAVATTCSAATVLGWYGIKKHLNNTSLLTVEAKDVNSQDSEIKTAVQTQRELRFLSFASVEYEGNVYMTPQDFLESVTEEAPRPRTGRTRLVRSQVESYLKSTPNTHKGSVQMFRKLHDGGILSYTEYLFLLCVLTKPHSGFRIAFNMFDTDGNNRVDKQEFLVLEALLAGGSTLVRHQNPHQHHGLQQDDGSTDTGDSSTMQHLVRRAQYSRHIEPECHRQGDGRSWRSRLVGFSNDEPRTPPDILKQKYIEGTTVDDDDASDDASDDSSDDASWQQLINLFERTFAREQVANTGVQRIPPEPGKNLWAVLNDKSHINKDPHQAAHTAHTQETTLCRHFFGKHGKDVLKFEDFHRFMDNIQTEVIELEYQEFARGMPTITEEEFARILLRYTTLSNDQHDEYLNRLRLRIPHAQGITFNDFKNFSQFLNNLDDFTIAMRMYTFADQPVSEGEFRRAVKVCTGFDLDTHLVHTVFQLFDIDGDGHLSHKEFISVMRDRLHRGLKQQIATNKWDEYKACVKTELRKAT